MKTRNRRYPRSSRMNGDKSGESGAFLFSRRVPDFCDSRRSFPTAMDFAHYQSPKLLGTSPPLHTAAEPAVRSAVRILVSQRNHTITASFFAANKNKYSEQVPLASTSSYLEYSGFNFTRNSIFCSKEDNYYPTLRYSPNYERVAMPSIFGAKVEV